MLCSYSAKLCLTAKRRGGTRMDAAHSPPADRVRRFGSDRGPSEPSGSHFTHFASSRAFDAQLSPILPLSGSSAASPGRRASAHSTPGEGAAGALAIHTMSEDTIEWHRQLAAARRARDEVRASRACTCVVSCCTHAARIAACGRAGPPLTGRWGGNSSSCAPPTLQSVQRIRACSLAWTLSPLRWPRPMRALRMRRKLRADTRPRPANCARSRSGARSASASCRHA